LGGIGQRLRELEELGAQAYRFAGDEHVLHVPGARQSEAVKVLTRLYDDFAQPFELKNGSHAFLTISTGVVLYPDHGTSAEELLKKADIAMRDAEKVRNSYRFFDDSLAKDVSESITIGQGLRSALFNNELDVEYQPQCDVKTDCVCGFEALLRWNSPSLGPVPPSRFIPLAERSGSIVPMGQMVLERACRFIKKVHTSGYPHATVSVNVSIQQLLRQDYVESVVGTLDREGLDPKYLELEITESLLMESYPLIRDKLSVLRQYGVRIALDDFGTGYSSLRHLRELPISVLKIDKAFLDELQVPGHRILTGEIIAIGKGMGMTIVAEGIEHPEQLAFLKECGCDRFQGYLYSKPLPENAIFSNLSSLAKRGCH
jgi:predicted signal transduction protein with EAL and GGDEF domain